MSVPHFTPRLGILVRTHGICPGHLSEYNNRCGFILPSPFSPTRFHVKLFPVNTWDIICVPPENLMPVTNPSKETLRSYIIALRAEAKVYDKTDPPFALHFLNAVEEVHEHLRTSDRILLATYRAALNPEYSTGANYLQNLLDEITGMSDASTSTVKSALQECCIELAKMHCESGAFEKARQVIRKVSHQIALDDDRKQECIDVLRTILRNAPENDTSMRHKACLEIIRLKHCDEEARQFLEQGLGEDENDIFASNRAGSDRRS